MKLKSLMLGGAAALISVSAIAADLPSTKSAPAQYVRVCDVYGRGFFYIPGTDTCLKVGGLVRTEYTWVGSKNAYNAVGGNVTNPGGGAIFTNKNGMDNLGWEVRGRLDMDARTQTAWGTVQTVIQIRLVSASGAYKTGYDGAQYVAGNAFDPRLQRAFIRFAGFTFGRAAEIFAFDSFDNYINHRRHGFANGVKQLAYTATFGNGFSATLGLEAKDDFNAARSASALNPIAPVGVNPNRATATGPQRLPAIVGNLRADGSWGKVQIMAGAIPNQANFQTPAVLGVTNANGPLVTKWGYAVGAGATIKLPMLAPGDEMMVVGAIGRGAMDWISGFSTSAYTSYIGHYLNGLTRVDNNMYVYRDVAGNVRSELTGAWAVAGLFRHNWTPTLTSWFGASYLNVRPGNATRNTDWQAGGLTNARTFSLTKGITWFPVQGFELGLDVGYHKLMQGVAKHAAAAAPTGVAVAAACPGGVAGCSPFAANFKINPTAWTVTARAERRF